MPGSTAQVILPPTLSQKFSEFQYSVHVPPKSLKREVVSVFPDAVLTTQSSLLVIPTFQKSSIDLLEYGDEQAAEKDRLLEQFFEWCECVYKLVKEAQPEAWVDATDPASGTAWKGASGSCYSDVDGIIRLLRYETIDAGGCRVVAHPQWRFSVYPATLFTTATQAVINRVLTEISMEFLTNAEPNHPIFVQLERIANDVHLVDNHAHPFNDFQSSPTQHLPRLENILTEATPVHSNAPTITSRSSLALSRSVRDMKNLLSSSLASTSNKDLSTHEPEIFEGPPKDEDLVEYKRAQLGVWPLASICFRASRIFSVLIDDGLPHLPNTTPVSYSDFETKLDVPIARRVLRLECEAEKVLSRLIITNEHSMWKPTSRSYKAPFDIERKSNYFALCFRRAFRECLNPLPHHVVSFKSVAAYRSTLEINLERTDEDLNHALQLLIDSPPSPPHYHVRIISPVIIDVVVKEGLEAARFHDIPIQFHCGFGDTDVDITKANPALLRSVLHTYPDVNIVLLHAAWPYVREAAFLASTYPCVFVDFSLVILLLSVRGMFRVVDLLFEIAPMNKLLYGSDAHSVPDLFYLGAIWGRKVVAAALTASVLAGDLGLDEAEVAIRKILANNSARLYKLPLPS